MSGEMTAIAMGVHVLDVLVRPVDAIPEGQGGQLVEEIRVTAAGSAGGAAITLAGARGRRHLASGPANGRADLGQRVADPAERRASGLPRDRRQPELWAGRCPV